MSKINVRVFETWPVTDRTAKSKELSAVKVDDDKNKAKVKQAVRKLLTEKGWNVMAVSFTAGKEGGVGMVATVTHDAITRKSAVRGKPVRRAGAQGGALGADVKNNVKGIFDRAKAHGRATTGTKKKR